MKMQGIQWTEEGVQVLARTYAQAERDKVVDHLRAFAKSLGDEMLIGTVTELADTIETGDHWTAADPTEPGGLPVCEEFIRASSVLPKRRRSRGAR